MLSAKLRSNWPALAVVLCATMLIVLAGLQFAWTGQLSQAQEAMMQNALSNSMRQCEQAIEQELMYLLVQFQPRARGARQQAWNFYSNLYALWAQTASHPQLIRRMLFNSYGPDGSSVLRELSQGAVPASIATWDGELAGLRDARDVVSDRRGRELRPFAWTVYPDAQALVRPEQYGRNPDREQDGVPRPGLVGHLIVVLDWAYITDTLLPEIVGRLFSGPDGEQLYEVAISAGSDSRVLYRSDPAIGSDWLAGADRRRRFRLLRDPSVRGPGPGGGTPGDDRRRTGVLGGRNDRPRGPEGVSGPGRRPPTAGRPRVVVAGGNSIPELEIAATHISGSLAGVVERQRARSLGTGLGVLLVLAGAMALVVVSARRAEQLAGMQMEFIAGVSHELRTPLSVIRSVGENLADGVVRADAQVRRYGELIRDQGLRLSEMVEQTLQFAALESGKRRFHFVWLDPAKAAGNALDLARPMIKQAGFALELGEDQGLPLARVDEKAVQQILANLLSNAVKYGEPGRWVRVETGADETNASSGVQIRVCDRGKGIPASDAGRVFDAYYRGAAAVEEGIQGSGLGLKLARDLALGMGGHLSLCSEPGKGSVFTLHLPTESQANA